MSAWQVLADLVLTGPRRGELASITVGQLHLDVPPRTAQAAMRHSSLHLTMNVYTDPTLLDVAGALEALPSLPRAERPKLEPASQNSA